MRTIIDYLDEIKSSLEDIDEGIEAVICVVTFADNEVAVFSAYDGAVPTGETANAQAIAKLVKYLFKGIERVLTQACGTLDP